MKKGARRKTKPVRPYYVARRVSTVADLEAVLNELRDEGFRILHILPEWGGYTVVALMPAL